MAEAPNHLEDGWAEVGAQDAQAVTPDVAGSMWPRPKAFDPASGDWLHQVPETNPAARRHDGQASFWTVVLALDLAVLAVLLVATIGLAAMALLHLGPDLASLSNQSGPTLVRLLWVQAIFNIVTMAAIPLVWAWRTRIGGWVGAKAYLQLHAPGKSIVQGLALGVALLGGLFLLGLILSAFHYETDNTSTQEIVRALSPALAVVLAISAGLGEEVLFRGILQKRLGWFGQAVVFGLFHLSYGTLLQFLVPFALGVVFGLMIKRGRSLWVTITAHFVFDFAQFALGIIATRFPPN